MKYIIAFFCVLLLVMMVSGCTDQRNGKNVTNGDINIITSEFNPNATTLEIYGLNTSEIIKTRVIKIEGSSEQNATVTINGEPVTLRPSYTESVFTYEAPVKTPMKIEIIAKTPDKEPSTITIIIEEITNNYIKMTANCTGAAGVIDPSLPKI